MLTQNTKIRRIGRTPACMVGRMVKLTILSRPRTPRKHTMTVPSPHMLTKSAGVPTPRTHIENRATHRIGHNTTPKRVLISQLMNGLHRRGPITMDLRRLRTRPSQRTGRNRDTELGHHPFTTSTKDHVTQRPGPQLLDTTRITRRLRLPSHPSQQVIHRPKTLRTVIDQQLSHPIRTRPKPHKRLTRRCLTTRLSTLTINLENLPSQLVPNLPHRPARRESQHRTLHQGRLLRIQHPSVLNDRVRLLQIQLTTLQRPHRLRQPLHHRHRGIHPPRSSQRRQLQLSSNLISRVIDTRVRIRSQRREPREETHLISVQAGTLSRHHPQLGEQLIRRQRLNGGTTCFDHGFDTTTQQPHQRATARAITQSRTPLDKRSTEPERTVRAPPTQSREAAPPTRPPARQGDPRSRETSSAPRWPASTPAGDARATGGPCGSPAATP